MISYELVQTIYLDKLLIQFRICSEKIFNVLMLVGHRFRQYAKPTYAAWTLARSNAGPHPFHFPIQPDPSHPIHPLIGNGTPGPPSPEFLNAFNDPDQGAGKGKGTAASQAHSVRQSIGWAGSIKIFLSRKWLNDCLYSASQALKLARLWSKMTSFTATISLSSFTKEST